MKTEYKINNMIDKAIDAEGRFPGMSYEQGVRYALEWVMEYVDEAPIQEEEER